MRSSRVDPAGGGQGGEAMRDKDTGCAQGRPGSWRSESGQSATLVGLILSAVVVLGIGGVGLAGAFATRSALQAAADAAALAAAGQAAASAVATVSEHALKCGYTPNAPPAPPSWGCASGPGGTVRVRGSLAQLDGDGLDALAGCAYQAPAQPPTGAQGLFVICDSVQRTQTYWSYPVNAAPLVAAQASLAANGPLLRGSNNPAITAFTLASDGSGTVALSLQAGYPAGLLGVIIGQSMLPLKVRALAWPRSGQAGGG